MKTSTRTPKKGKPLSHQRLWQLKQTAQGLCTLCTREVSPWSRSLCDYHLDYYRNKARQKIGAKKWYVKMRDKEAGRGVK